jgi:hypothetical protein
MTSRKKWFSVLFALSIMIFTQPAISGPLPSGCTTDNVEISKLTVEDKDNFIYLRGIVKHNCKGAIGIELKWDSKYKDGSVAFSRKFWPNSVQNIPSNTEFPFETMSTSKIPTETNSVGVVRVRAW